MEQSDTDALILFPYMSKDVSNFGLSQVGWLTLVLPYSRSFTVANPVFPANPLAFSHTPRLLALEFKCLALHLRENNLILADLIRCRSMIDLRLDCWAKSLAQPIASSSIKVCSYLLLTPGQTRHKTRYSQSTKELGLHQ